VLGKFSFINLLMKVSFWLPLSPMPQEVGHKGGKYYIVTVSKAIILG
jgi:hypothetical protein